VGFETAFIGDRGKQTEWFTVDGLYELSNLPSNGSIAGPT